MILIVFLFQVENKYEKQNTIIIIIAHHFLGKNIILYEVPRLLFNLHV